MLICRTHLKSKSSAQSLSSERTRQSRVDGLRASETANIRPSHRLIQEKGFTLIEVMVALVVLSAGLIGLLVLQLHSLASNHNAYLTSVASIQAMSFEELIRANPGAVDIYKDINLSDLAPAGPSHSCEAENSSGCSPEELAVYDMNRWTYATRQLFPKDLRIEFERLKNTIYKLTLSWSSPVFGAKTPAKKRNFTYIFRIAPAR